jgi:hypothetical protein
MDSFTKEIRTIMELGTLAFMSGDAFKALLIKKVRAYSAELELLNEEVSELFLDLTDLIVTGNFSRMPPDALKVYAALAVLNNKAEETSRRLGGKLSDLTGLKDEPALKDALNELEVRGYIDSLDNPILKRVRSTRQSRLYDFDSPPVRDISNLTETRIEVRQKPHNSRPQGAVSE